jgi:hypothetical protein
MEAVAELAGYYAAHAVCILAEHETFDPTLTFLTNTGKQEMQRIVAPEARQAVESGRKRMAEPPEGTACAVLVIDGRINLQDGKCDAIIIEAVQYAPDAARFSMAIPYRNSKSKEGFAIYRPKFLGHEGPEPNYDAIATAFFRGVDSHKEGGPIWSAKADPSR